MENLEIKKYGLLLPLAPYPKKKIMGNCAWMCKCDCGNYAVVSEFALVTTIPSKKKNSCGCDGNRKPLIVVDINKMYGKLQIIKFADKFIDDEPIFLCKCDCGNTSFKTKLFNLRRNKIHSCGCVQLKKNLNNITKQFIEGTNLTRISRTEPLSNNQSSSGVIGVSWNNNKKQWHACLTFQRKKVLNRYYDNLSDAITARKAAEEKYFEPLINKYKNKEE